MDDQRLIKDFVESGAEEPFQELVEGHLDLVYAAALRQLAGDADLARDAAQRTFCELARQARRLTGYRNLSGWLYTTSTFVARRMRRTEVRRAARESAFFMDRSQTEAAEPSWSDVRLVLDDAMHELSERDREAVILRYFRNQPLAAVGHAIGASESAARMRVERALEKLRVVLQGRGIRSSAGALGTLLLANAMPAAPAGLATVLAAPAVACAGALGHSVGILTFMSAAKIKAGAVVLLVGGAAVGLVVSERQKAHLRVELAETQRQLTEQEAQPITRADAQPDVLLREQARAMTSELMRLRAEITQLKARPGPPGESPVKNQSAASRREEITEIQRKEAMRTLGLAKMNVAKGWGVAFTKFAQANEGRMPRDFQEAAPHYPPIPEELSWLQGLAGSDFEITFRGSFEQIENPTQAIILREKEAFNTADDGSADRTYLFADGHCEIHRAVGGNFEPWEQEHQPTLRVATSAAGTSR